MSRRMARFTPLVLVHPHRGAYFSLWAHLLFPYEFATLHEHLPCSIFVGGDADGLGREERVCLDPILDRRNGFLFCHYRILTSLSRFSRVGVSGATCPPF